MEVDLDINHYDLESLVGLFKYQCSLLNLI